MITKIVLDETLGDDKTGFYNYLNQPDFRNAKNIFLHLKKINVKSRAFQNMLIGMREGGAITETTITALNAL
jgi:hypothetical protein